MRDVGVLRVMDLTLPKNRAESKSDNLPKESRYEVLQMGEVADIEACLQCHLQRAMSRPRSRHWPRQPSRALAPCSDL